MATNVQSPQKSGIEFYGGYEVYSDSGIDLTLLDEKLKLTVAERLETNSRSARSLEAFRRSTQESAVVSHDNGGQTVFDAEPFLRHLISHEIDFVVIGGLAMVAQGSAYITNDADICYRRTPLNIDNLAKAFASLHPRLRGNNLPPDLPFRFDSLTIQAGLNFTLTTDLGPIDLLGEVAGVGMYDKVLAASDEKNAFGLAIRVLTIDGLIAAKKAADRVKDRLHILELEELKKKREANP